MYKYIINIIPKSICYLDFTKLVKNYLLSLGIILLKLYYIIILFK